MIVGLSIQENELLTGLPQLADIVGVFHWKDFGVTLELVTEAVQEEQREADKEVEGGRHIKLSGPFDRIEEVIGLLRSRGFRVEERDYYSRYEITANDANEANWNRVNAFFVALDMPTIAKRVDASFDHADEGDDSKMVAECEAVWAMLKQCASFANMFDKIL